MDHGRADDLGEAVRLVVAPFAVEVTLRSAPGFGGRTIEVVPPDPGMARVEVRVPAGPGDGCIVAAGSGYARMHAEDDPADILDLTLEVVQAAAYGHLQTAGETLYLLGNRGWTARGRWSPVPRLLRPRSRYAAYPAADPPPVLRDLVRAAVGQVLARFDAESEESVDDHGWAVRIEPADPRAPRVLIHAGQDDWESWSIVEVDGVGTGCWQVHDWGDEGGIASGLLATLIRIASGQVRVALDDIATLWFARRRGWQAVGPQAGRLRRRRPYDTLTPWPRRHTAASTELF